MKGVLRMGSNKGIYPLLDGCTKAELEEALKDFMWKIAKLAVIQ